MNLLHIISQLAQVDPEVYERLDSRRRVFRHLSGLGGKLATAAVPLAVATIFNKAYAGATATQATIVEVLQFALVLENLEANFYNAGINATTSAMLSPNNLAALNLIKADENHHVSFLQATIQSLGAAPVMPAVADFDYTGAQGGSRNPLFASVLTNATTLLDVGQALEDTGVRAYKGSATDLMLNRTVLEAALNIHSVEARHAARLRTMRRGGLQPANDRASRVPANPATPGASPKSWVSKQDAGGPQPPATAPVYAAGSPAVGAPTSIFFPGEENVIQGVADITALLVAANIPGLTDVATAASEAFDEPLDMASVKAIARNFVKTGSPTFALLA